MVLVGLHLLFCLKGWENMFFIWAVLYWNKLQSLFWFGESFKQMWALNCSFQVWLSHLKYLSIISWKSPFPMNRIGKCISSWVDLWVFGIQWQLSFSSRLLCYFWQAIIVSRMKMLNMLVSWLMKKVSSVPPYYTDLLSHRYTAERQMF